jgi:hypothetical protein
MLCSIKRAINVCKIELGRFPRDISRAFTRWRLDSAFLLILGACGRGDVCLFKSEISA